MPATCCCLTCGTEPPAAAVPPPSRSGPPPAAAEAPPPAAEPGPVRRPRSHLAPVLSCLRRAAGLTPRALADRLGVSLPETSDILSGEHFPGWPLTERFAHVCGADPMVLRKVWQDEKLREHLPRPPAAGAPACVVRLHSALRALYTGAGCPGPDLLAGAACGALGPEEIAAALDGRPSSWPRLAALVEALGGEPARFRPLWEATRPAAGEGHREAGCRAGPSARPRPRERERERERPA